MSFLHEDFGQCGVHGVKFDIGDVILGHLEAGDTVGRDRYLDRSNPVAIPAWRLLVGRRCRGVYRRFKRQDGSGRRARRSGQ